MAASLDIELRAVSAPPVTSSGASDAIDIEYLTSTSSRVPRSAAQLVLEPMSIVGSGRVTIAVETSTDGASWSKAKSAYYDKVDEPISIVAAPLRRFVRATWTLPAGVTSTSFALRGQAHQVYADPKDVVDLVIPERAIAEVSMQDRWLACIAASDVAESFVSKAFTTPLRSWGGAIRMQAAHLAAALMFRRRGKDSQGADASVFEGETRALSWFNQLGAGKNKPPEVVDSTPETYEAAGSVVVVTRPSRRGW